MPRWLFLSLLAGGIIVGLYLRSRSQGEPPPPSEDTLAGSGDAGLAGVGVASPPGGVVPVATPTTPEGFPELIGSLTDVIGGLAAGYNPPGTPAPDAINNSPGGAGTPVQTTPPTGGGPPSRRHHFPPIIIPRREHVRTTKGGRRQIIGPRGKVLATVPKGQAVHHRPAKKHPAKKRHR